MQKKPSFLLMLTTATFLSCTNLGCQSKADSYFYAPPMGERKVVWERPKYSVLKRCPQRQIRFSQRTGKFMKCDPKTGQEKPVVFEAPKNGMGLFR